MFNNSYQGKKVLITGHTGFKGSWLSSWMIKLGANVVGLSKDIPSSPSMFEELHLDEKMGHNFGDIRDINVFRKLYTEFEPDFVFHLAAQAIVSSSYANPIETISTNVMGTANVMEALRNSDHPCVAVIITSDKCYENVEWIWGYKETDMLGGKDIYSASKGAAEIIFQSYYQSFFKKQNSKVRVVSARAGNVIGGGDWALDRIVPDCMRSWSEDKIVEIRSPKATRPWQHVLEPLSGYLNLAFDLAENPQLSGESFNFGPNSVKNYPVERLLVDLSKCWDYKDSNDAYRVVDEIKFHEAGLLKLNCEKAFFDLKWEPTLNYEQLIDYTGNWYYEFYKKDTNMFDFTMCQIENYEQNAISKEIRWTTI